MNGFLGNVFIDDLHSFAAVVTHVFAIFLVELFTQELKLQFPTANEGLFTVGDDAIKGVEILVFAVA